MKKERRKEKKREKRERREKAGQEHEGSKHSEHSHKKRKYEEGSQLNQNDSYNAKATAGAVEQLERSGLTEENEQPCFIQNIYDSSESSQDSSKRRKLVATNVNQNNHGEYFSVMCFFLSRLHCYFVCSVLGELLLPMLSRC